MNTDAGDQVAPLPRGWTRAGVGHPLAGWVLDEFDRPRMDGYGHVIGLVDYVRDVADGLAPLVLDDTWATRDAVAAVIADQLDAEASLIGELERYGRVPHAVDRARDRMRRLRDLAALAADTTLIAERRTAANDPGRRRPERQ